MHSNASDDAAQPVLVPITDTPTRRCVVTTRKGSVLQMYFDPMVDVRHIARESYTVVMLSLVDAMIRGVANFRSQPICAGEVVVRHNTLHKDLGRIRRTRLTHCMDAEDNEGRMLTSDLVLQGLQACAATRTGCSG